MFLERYDGWDFNCLQTVAFFFGKTVENEDRINKFVSSHFRKIIRVAHGQKDGLEQNHGRIFFCKNE